MSDIQTLISRSQVHPEWQPLVSEALLTLVPDYRRRLITDSDWLPGIDYLLNAFQRDVKNLKYILFGESPFPRAQSANGIAFYDAAVGQLWSDNGLSKAVNRATSIRNLLKAALLAEGRVRVDDNGKVTQAQIAAIDKTGLVETMAELFKNLHKRGFLMLNAALVLHPDRRPTQEAKFWQTFIDKILALLTGSSAQPITLILWGKIAAKIEVLPASKHYNKIKCEHPYNISFIHNPIMQPLLAELKILCKG